ncbi:hypothetical protein SCP_0102050 [Sparassis crispa]|uniref:Uncharacterized protein n=1 Tax=Sparassis crispa TaxID=139825 RepID=A0A401G592_9APHY|nr:hypothetical protein SCP_0102050 [Sparassis crispa]GBE77332.1 hypothetical protein SCP_0102050 [Sparassis crispa]
MHALDLFGYAHLFDTSPGGIALPTRDSRKNQHEPSECRSLSMPVQPGLPMCLSGYHRSFWCHVHHSILTSYLFNRCRSGTISCGTRNDTFRGVRHITWPHMQGRIAMSVCLMLPA